jgi:hypothetical protein
MIAATLEQALFTSVRTGANEGYQISEHSSGIDAATRRELSTWGPSHDSLQSDSGQPCSINLHTLVDGRCCLSLTRAASPEYSGRGANTSTWMLLAQADALAMFGHHPLRLLDAALTAQWTNLPATAPLSLVGRGRSVNLEAVAQASSLFGPATIAAMVDAALSKTALGIVISGRTRLLIDTLLSLIPLDLRGAVSFSTGLIPSLQRRFQIQCLLPHAELQQQFVRTAGGMIVDPTSAGTQPTTEGGRDLARLLEQQRWCEVRRRIVSPMAQLAAAC